MVTVGKDLGLKGEALIAFVEKRANEQMKREERMKERELQKAEIEAKNKGEEIKLAMLEKEVELEKAKHPELLTSSSISDASTRAKVPKLPNFDDLKDNIDAYLQRFERFAISMKWDKAGWSISLSALLKGQALDVYSRLAPVDALNYDKLKDALLKRFQMTEEGFRLKFRSSKPVQGETASQFAVRSENYLLRWIEMAKAGKAFDGLKDLLLREQCLQASSGTLALYLRERAPKTIVEMTELAEKYTEAHVGKGISFPVKNNPVSFVHKTCYDCGQKDHISKDCLARQNRGSVRQFAGYSQK